MPSEQPTDPPLIIVSNRGPAQFDRDADGERVISRGGGGLVTALTGLATHRRVLWVASDTVAVDGLLAGPGLFVDPCGGARFDREGRLVAGDADRGLDYFRTYSELGGEVVDLSVLFCGQAGPLGVPVVPATPTVPPPPPPPAGTTTPAVPLPPPGALTASATPTAVPTDTSTPTATPSPQRTAEPEACERVDEDVSS